MADSIALSADVGDNAAANAPANPTYVYVGAFVDELRRVGVRHAVVCPGSRSTPLALTLAAQSAIRVWMHVDERSAAFFALGLAKESGQPVAIVCTSGTAAANFLPAVVEAHLTHLPLLVLTADRPAELRDTGAPQAIDQNRLYGVHTKWFVDVALPEATNDALRAVRTLADRAAATACALPAGPVHLNFPFREPLTPEPRALPPTEQRDPVAWYGRPGDAPFTCVSDSPLAAASDATIARIAGVLGAARHPLLLAGPGISAADGAALLALASAHGIPLLADPLTSLRADGAVIATYDALLHSERFVSAMPPDVIVRFGAMPTSKPLLLYLKRYPQCPQIVIDGASGWEEPTHLAAEVVHTDPAACCAQLDAALAARRATSDATSDATTEAATEAADWAHRWHQADALARETLGAALRDFAEPFEGRVFAELAEVLPAGATLFVGNSMPVRDCDTFFWPRADAPITVRGNRGANGIDGVVSSALGVSAATERHPVVLVIGDLSLYHDMNGLLAARLHGLDLTIVLINNDGGGIFSFLPQASYPEHFEQIFGTPTGLDFSLVAHLYGATHTRAVSWDSFRAALHDSVTTGGLHLVEVTTERASNVTMHRRLWATLEPALERHGGLLTARDVQ